MKLFFRELVLLLFIILMLCGCGPAEPQIQQNVDTVMGTVVQQTLYVKGKDDLTEEILSLLYRLEEETLSWRLETAELYQINQYAGSGKWLELSGELSGILRQCMELTADTGGAFDVALGPAARLWDIDGWVSGQREGDFQVPDRQALEQALVLCGSERIQLQFPEDEESALLQLEEGAALDLGAVGKGFALDQILSLLEADPNVTGGVVSVGGSVLTYGTKPGNTAWRVGIADPFDPSDNLGILTLTGQWCVSTSGDYERYVEEEGVQYHHILDPTTGYPADSGLVSVTVLTKNGLLSDALSTACFVLGKEQGMLLVKRYGAEALFVDKNGEIFMTSGMETLFQNSL